MTRRRRWRRTDCSFSSQNPDEKSGRLFFVHPHHRIGMWCNFTNTNRMWTTIFSTIWLEVNHWLSCPVRFGLWVDNCHLSVKITSLLWSSELGTTGTRTTARAEMNIFLHTSKIVNWDSKWQTAEKVWFGQLFGEGCSLKSTIWESNWTFLCVADRNCFKVSVIAFESRLRGRLGVATKSVHHISISANGSIQLEVIVLRNSRLWSLMWL